jgi:hypothetical protein
MKRIWLLIITSPLIAIAWTAMIAAQGAPFHRVTNAELQQLLAKAVAANAADPKKSVEVEFGSLVHETAPGYGGDIRPINYENGLLVMLRGRVDVVRSQIGELNRKMEPISEKAIQWPSGFVVWVAPTEVDSPDIEKVVLQRDGKIVPPLSSTLAPKEFTTRMGAKTMLHEGEVVYSDEAFLPGAEVVVTAIPAVGGNIVKKFSDAELRAIQ